MNKISKFSTINKNVIIGKNNIIHNDVVIHNNVTIGNNNVIYNNTIIYPNCIIGNNNVILNNNIIGEYFVDTDNLSRNKIYNGVIIGNNNYLHTNNIICGGKIKKTNICNNNKLLSEVRIGHDANITSNVTLYPRSSVAGYSILLPYSVMGMCSSIQQRRVIGHYSMIGMNNPAANNIFPYFIFINNMYKRLNIKQIKINNDLECIYAHEEKITNLMNHVKINNFDDEYFNEIKTFPQQMQLVFNEFYTSLIIKKI